LFPALSLYSRGISGQILMKKFVTLGTECVEYLKATMASEGNPFPHTLLIFRAFLFCFI
jgi:hypothetical protein